MYENDKLLEMFFEPERWTAAINKGLDKDMSKRILTALTKKEVRAEMYQKIRDGQYQIFPPHTARIPKDNGEFRTVYINEPIDRIFLSIANDLLMETCDSMIHPSCKSYQKGIGCGKVVKEVVERVMQANGKTAGWKADFSKYFDSVPIKFIDGAFDEAEGIIGKSVIIDILRQYYHSDIYFDLDGNLCEAYQSLKQGCAVASWLANVVMYDLDRELVKFDGVYVRYSDDTLFVGPDYEKAISMMKNIISTKGLTLNPKKVEYISECHWFKFLGFQIKGGRISLSKNRIKTFQREIQKRTIKNRKHSFKAALNKVNRYLYKGYGPDSYSWASQVLPVINCHSDILELDKFVMDCLRAVQTGKRRVGGLGCNADGIYGFVQRGRGRNVTANRGKCPGNIEGYLTLGCMKKAIHTSKELYYTLVSRL